MAAEDARGGTVTFSDLGEAGVTALRPYHFRRMWRAERAGGQTPDRRAIEEEKVSALQRAILFPFALQNADAVGHNRKDNT